MRKNQVSINITRFGDEVPKDLETDVMEITIYATLIMFLKPYLPHIMRL